jgi:hypothetical protein
MWQQYPANLESIDLRHLEGVVAQRRREGKCYLRFITGKVFVTGGEKNFLR